MLSHYPDVKSASLTDLQNESGANAWIDTMKAISSRLLSFCYNYTLCDNKNKQAQRRAAMDH